MEFSTGNKLYQLEKGEKTKYHFAYNQFRDIILCPHRYELMNIQKLPQVFELRRLLIPNVIDQALTEWIQAKFDGSLKSIVQLRYAEYVKRNSHLLNWKNSVDYRDCQIDANETADKLELAMRNNNLCKPDAITQSNIRVGIILSNGEKVRLTGRLDLLYTESLEIYDLKTTKNKKWLDEDQVIFYDFITSLALGKKIKRCGFLAPLIDPPVQLLPFVGQKEWDKLFEDLNKGITTIDSGEFPDQGDEKKDCFMCFAKKHCKRYRPRAINPTQYKSRTKAGF